MGVWLVAFADENVANPLLPFVFTIAVFTGGVYDYTKNPVSEWFDVINGRYFIIITFFITDVQVNMVIDENCTNWSVVWF